jgi:hypothetical protein
MKIPKKKQPPAYQMYASDVLATKEYRMMNLEQRGLFLSLHLDTWVNDEVPYDTKDLALFLKIPYDEVTRARSTHLHKFFIKNGDYFQCPEHDDYKAMLEERRQKQSKGGKKGQRIKQSKAKGVPSSEPEGSRVEESSDELSSKEVSREKSSSGETSFKHISEGIEEWVREYDDAKEI